MQITGRVFIKVDGKVLRSNTGATLDPGGFKRDPVVGNAVHGFTEEAMAPEVECTISHAADTSLKELGDIKDVTLVFETDTGKNFTLNHAWLATTTKLTGGKGEVPLKFHAMSCDEA